MLATSHTSGSAPLVYEPLQRINLGLNKAPGDEDTQNCIGNKTCIPLKTLKKEASF